MEEGSNNPLSLTFFLLFCFISNCCFLETRTTLAHNTEDLQTYIVHVEAGPNSTALLTSEERQKWFESFLPTGEKRLIYSYHNVISGFAARLTEQEAADMEKKSGFLQAYPDRVVPLQTTHTPEFLGLQNSEAGLWRNSGFGKGVIIGILDTGISPDLPSFRDNGKIPPRPAKWNGGCEFGPSICNNKLIGAKNFIRGMHAMQQDSATSSKAPPYDTEGHGTHTASTAGGIFVNSANVEGRANGTAEGMAPYAHLAIYKVCNERGCADSDILAAMDSAVSDGVDVMSLSLGGHSLPFHSDSIAIGAFGATEKGIFVSCAGGNSGPYNATLSNEAPWILTVGASTIDRELRSTVELGNGNQFDGQSIHQPSGFPSTPLSLVFPGARSSDAAFCIPGSLHGINVKGKVVVCDVGEISGVDKGEVVKKAGGAAMIITNLEDAGFVTMANLHVLPASHVSYSAGRKIKSYIKSTSSPTASISFKGTVIGKSLAPVIAYFSSRGPNQADPNILKPDIIGPGVNILAAWPFKTGRPGTKFNIISGTSMATPHLSGIAALLKSVHPDWSPAGIKSAIMTTAYTEANNGSQIPDENHNPANLFAIGAGHVNPTAASKPGLIYDIETKDYIAYLCGMRYTDNQVSAIARRKIKCSNIRHILGAELNYPSFMVFLHDGESIRITRTVTNVGAPGSVYSVNIKRPSGVSVIIVDPKILVFCEKNEKAQYSVTFTGKGSRSGVTYTEGHLTWISSDNCTKVNSPIMVAIGNKKMQSM